MRMEVSRIRVAIALLGASLVALPALAAAQCSGNSTHIQSVSGAPTIPSPTLANYVAGTSQPSANVVVTACCGNSGGGNRCEVRVVYAAATLPNLTNVEWRLISLVDNAVNAPAQPLRCPSAIQNVALNTWMPMATSPTSTGAVVFRMQNPNNGGRTCVGTIQFRETAMSFTSHVATNTYSRGAAFSIVKNSSSP